MSDLSEFLRPSSASTWTVCVGYPLMRSKYPEAPEEADDDVREDGVACHWLAHQIWLGLTPALDSLSPNNRTLDMDMFDAVDLYHGVLRSWPGVVPVCEQQIACDVIYPGMKGTPDAWAYNPSTRTLYIADLKYGFRFVEVWFNWQLIVYAAALLELLQLDDRATMIEFTIVQPRSHHGDGPVRTWRTPASELRAYVNILKGAAADANKPNPPCVPNPGCNDCPARHACVALQQSSLRALELSYRGVPLELSPEAAGDELRRLKEAQKHMDARITGLESQVEGMLRNGQSVPWWSMEKTYARERWRDGCESQVMTLGVLYGVNTTQPAKALSPAQARKVLPPEIVALYAHKPSTGVRLTKADPLAATKRFSQ